MKIQEKFDVVELDTFKNGFRSLNSDYPAKSCH